MLKYRERVAPEIYFMEIGLDAPPAEGIRGEIGRGYAYFS